MKNFKAKVFVITGAGSGIGRALAQQLAAAGAILILNDICHDKLHGTVQAVNAAGGTCCPYVADISDAQAVRNFAESVRKDFGRVDGLINNAGVAIGRLDFEEISLEDWQWIMNINLWGTIHVTRSFLPLLRESPQARIANLSSIYGFAAAKQRAAYCVSKAAVRSLSESLRQELREQGVQVTTVLPGLVATSITRAGRGWKCADEQSRAAWITETKAPTDPAQAARQILKGIKAGKRKVIIGMDAWLLAVLAYLFPGYYDRIINFFVVKMERRLGRHMPKGDIPSLQRKADRA